MTTFLALALICVFSLIFISCLVMSMQLMFRIDRGFLPANTDYEELYNYNGNVNDFVEQYYQEPEEPELENKTIKPAIGQLELF